MRVCLAAQCHLARQCCKTAFNQINRKQQPAIFSDRATSVTHQRHDLRRGFAHANARKDIDRGLPDRVSLVRRQRHEPATVGGYARRTARGISLAWLPAAAA
jgi:hypothetical protein